MPYVRSEERVALATGKKRPMNPGELNYLITKLCIEYCDNHGFKYQTANDVIGALALVSREFCRRVIDPYEERKRGENGDVYESL